MALDFALMKNLVDSVARSVSSNFPPYVTAEDTAGQLWVWIYEKRSSIENTVRDDPQNWERKIASTMRKVASDYCAREKAGTEGYDLDDLYRYSIPKIKSLIEDVFSYQNWQTFGLKRDGQPGTKGQANETGDRVAELIDVRAAVARLPHDTKELLYYQYVHHYTTENLAEHFGITEVAARKRVQRSLGSVRKQLGRRGPEDGPRASDRRAVRTNAAWRASQSSQWDG